VSQDHQRKVLLGVSFRPEKVGQLHVIVVQQHAVDNEAADHPGEKDADPGKQKFLVHGPSLAAPR
jgi:hypothetical protein